MTTRRSVAILGTRGYPSYYGGFETLIRRLAPYLTDQGWDVSVYSRPGQVRDGGDPRVDAPTSWGVDTTSLSTLSYGLTSALGARRRRPDVALIMNVANGYWLPILKSRGIPTVVNVDGLEWEREKWGAPAKKVFHQGAVFTARHADTLVFDAERIGDYWREHFRREGLFIPYGGTAPTSTRLPEGLNHRGYVLCVARFVPENTMSEFLEAVPSLAQHHDVVIVGSSGNGGHYDERAQKLNDQFDRVQWLGHLSDDFLLHSLWAHAGTYFHGHSVGGTNPALVQAMACGAPIVARDSRFNREVLAGTALFAEPTAASIVAQVREVMTDPALQEKLSGEASRRADIAYSWPDVLGAYEGALEMALNGVTTERSENIGQRS